MTPITTSFTPLSTQDLALQGFTPEEIARLNELREIYPMPEFFSNAEISRLAFVKWQREHQLELDD